MPKTTPLPTDFDTFFAQHFVYYQDLARKDFEALQKGPWAATVSIETDDDFSLNIGESLEVHGNTQKEVTTALIEQLRAATFTYCKTWSATSNGTTKSGDYSHAWFSIRDEAIKQLRSGATQICYGGNQVIEIDISEKMTPDLKLGL